MSKIAEVKELNEIVTQIGTIDKNADDVIAQITKAVAGLSDEQLKLVLNTAQLDDTLLNQVNTYIEAQAATVGTTAAQTAQIGVVDALKAKYVGLGAAIKSALPWLIPVAVVGAGIAAFNLLYDTVEETAEKAKNLLQTFNDLKDAANQDRKLVESLASEYEQLSQGVNELGENISLTEDEFSRYHDIVNQIADISPTLVSGWDKEGNAILRIKGNVDELTEAYKRNQIEAYKTLIYGTEEGDSDASTVIKSYHDVVTGTSFGTSGWGNVQKIDYANQITQAAGQGIEALQKMYKESMEFGTHWFTDIVGVDGTKTIGKLTSEDLKNIQYNAKTAILEWQSEIDSELSKVHSVADAYLNLFLLQDEQYKDLEDNVKVALSKIVNSLTPEAIEQFGLTTSDAISKYVQTLLNSAQNDTIANTWVDLFTISEKDLSLKESKILLDGYIHDLAEYLGMDENILRIQLGLNIDTLYDNLKAVQDDAIAKWTGASPEAAARDAGARAVYEAESAAMEKFAKENSINTQDEIAFWNQCIEESHSREEAQKRYLAEVNINKSSLKMTAEQQEAYNTYENTAEKIKEIFDNVDQYTREDLMTMDIFEGYDWSNSEETVTESLINLLRNVLENTRKELGEFGDILLGDMLDTYNDAIGDEFAWYEKYTKLLEANSFYERVKDANEKNVGLSQSDIKLGLTKYDLSDAFIKSDDGGFTFDTDDVKAWVDGFIEAYNKAISQYSDYIGINIGEGVLSGQHLWAFLSNDDNDNKDTSQTFDWYETYLDRIGTKISELGDRANDSYSTWSRRNAELVNQLELLEGKKSVLEDIIKPAYEDKMESIGLSDHYKTLIKQGLWDSSDHTLGIETITDEKQIELIEEYLELYEKWQSAEQERLATQRELNEGESQKFENIASEFDNKLSIIESRISTINSLISLTEAKNHIVTQVVYDRLIAEEQANQALLIGKRDALVEQFNNSNIEKYSGEWYNMVDQINQATEAVNESTISLAEYDNQIQQINWDSFDRGVESIHDIVEEAEFLLELFGDDKLVDEFGKFTNAGHAVLRLHHTNYQTYLAEEKEYATELQDIRNQLADDPYNQSLVEREEELLGLQRESIQNAEKEKQSIIEISREAIQAQIDATQELIDKKKEALDAETELRDYQNSLTEKTDNIGNLRKQESVYALDNSEAGQQKLQTIRAELKDAEKDLDEFTYDKWHQDQTSMLDELMAEYTELQEARSADTETLFNDMTQVVNANAESVNAAINEKATELGINISNVAQGTSDVATAVGEAKDKEQEMIDALSSAQEAILGTENGDSGTGLAGVKSVLENILTYLKETLATGNTSASNSNGDGKSIIANAEASAAERVAALMGNHNGTTGTNSLLGRTVTASGKWYNSEYGEGGWDIVNEWSPDYWKIDKINEGTPYPYHIQAYIDDKPEGGSGWVKASQIGYKHGSKHINQDQYAWTNEGYGQNELHYRASDGALYTRLGEGDMIFTHEQTQKLWELTRGNLGVDYPMKQYCMPDVPTVVNGGNVYLDIGDVVLPNVREPEDFAVQLIDTLKHSSKAQKAIRAVSVDLLAGKSIMAVNKF